MKLLVSDYDKTIEIERIFRKPYIPKGTIPRIRKFMSEGNMFMIATSRPYNSIIEEIYEHDIPYDFVSTLNGSIIHDNDGNVLYSKEMMKLDIENLYKTFKCIEKIELIKNKDRDLYYIFKTKLFTSSKELIERLEKNGFNVQSWFMNTYNIVHGYSNKIDSIKFLQKELEISNNDIITIGDSSDDLQMIKDYYSFGIIKPLSNFEIINECDHKVKSLKDAFKYINKNI